MRLFYLLACCLEVVISYQYARTLQQRRCQTHQTSLREIDAAPQPQQQPQQQGNHAETAVRYNALRGVFAIAFEHAVKTGGRFRRESAASNSSSAIASASAAPSTIPSSHSWKDGVIRRYTSHEYLLPFSLSRSAVDSLHNAAAASSDAHIAGRLISDMHSANARDSSNPAFDESKDNVLSLINQGAEVAPEEPFKPQEAFSKFKRGWNKLKEVG
jgi:hypothetical protein